MKKRLLTVVMSFLILLTGVFVLSACDCNEDNSNAIVTSISVELVNDKYEMVDNTITVEYGTKVDLRYNDFKVIGNLDNGKTKELPKKYSNSDGYIFQSSIPQSYDKTPVNNYTIMISYGDLEAVTIKVSVTKADFNGSLNWNYTEPYTYDGEEKVVEIVDLPTGVTVEYEGVNSATVVGEYTCTAIFTCTNSSNYKDIENKTITWTIVPAKINVSAVALLDKTYTATEQTAEIAAATLPDNVVVEEITGQTRATVVGEYTVTIEFAVTGDNAANYSVDPMTTTWNITKGTYSTVGLVVIDGDSTFVYNGQERTVQLDYSGLDSNVSVVGSPTGVSATAAGDYTVVINLEYTGSDTNYNTTAGTITIDWTIEKAALTITAKDNNITYGDQLSYNGIYEPVGLVGNDTAAVLNGELQFSCDYEQYDPVGSYDIEICGYTADNYDITFVAGELVVGKKILTIKPKDITIEYKSVLSYNGVEIDGFVGEDNISVLGGAAEFECEYVVGSPVKDGGYIISVSGYTADNYDIVYETGVLTVTKSTIDVSSVRLEDNEFVYNGAVQSVAVDSNSLPAGVTVSNITMDRNGRETKAVSEYTAVVSLVYIDTVNFEPIPDVYLVWEIIKATVDISAFNIVNNTLEYNGQIQVVEFTELPAGAQMVNITGDRGKDANLYNCSVTISCADRANYNDFTENKTFDWRIAPKELVVTAKNHTIEYGNPGANAGVIYSGFVPGEDLSLFGGQIIYSYKKVGSGNYVAGSDIGTYIINIAGSSLYNNNYDITFINGQLTVVAKVVDLADYIGVWQSPLTREYNPTVSFTPKLTNEPDGVIATYTYTINDGSNEIIDSPIEIGSYIATVEFVVKNSNYNLINYYGVEGVDFEITKRVIDATTLVWTYADGSEIEYSSNSIKPTFVNSVPGIAVSYTYYKQNEELEFQELSADAEITEIGNYRVVATLEYDEDNFDFVAPAVTEVNYSIVKISVTATALTWNVDTVLDRKDETGIYYSAEVSHTGGYINISLSRNEYLLVEYFDGENYITTSPRFIEKGEYTIVARVSIKEEYASLYRLSTGGEYYTYNLVLGVSQIIFSTIKVDDHEYQLEDMIGKTNKVKLNSKLYYSIRSFYAFVRIDVNGDPGWTIVENGFEFTEYYVNDTRYTFYVVDKSINPQLDSFLTENGVIYEIVFDTYLIKEVIYGADNAVISSPKGEGAVYEYAQDETTIQITFDAESIELLDVYQFKYMIIDSDGEWLDPVDIDTVPLVFNNIESIYCIMILVAFDDTTNYQVTQVVLMPATHVSGFTVTSMEFDDSTVIVDEFGLGAWNKSICNGVVTDFTVNLKDEYVALDYTVGYFADKEHTQPVDYTNIGICYVVYFVIYDNNSQAVETGEFLMCHAFVPENYPLCMNAVDLEAEEVVEYSVSVDDKSFSLRYNILEDNGITIAQTYNGSETISLEDGVQVVEYALIITYQGVTYTFEMPITVICSLNVLSCFSQENQDAQNFPATYTTTDSQTGVEETKTYLMQMDYSSRTPYIDLTKEYDTDNIMELSTVVESLEFAITEDYEVVSKELVEINGRYFIKLEINNTAAVVNSTAQARPAEYYYIELLVKEADYLEFSVEAIDKVSVSLENSNFEQVEYNEKTYLVVKCTANLDDDYYMTIEFENFSTNLTTRIYDGETVIKDKKLFSIKETTISFNHTYSGRCVLINFDSDSKYGGIIVYFENSTSAMAPMDV